MCRVSSSSTCDFYLNDKASTEDGMTVSLPVPKEPILPKDPFHDEEKASIGRKCGFQMLSSRVFFKCFLGTHQCCIDPRGGCSESKDVESMKQVGGLAKRHKAHEHSVFVEKEIMLAMCCAFPTHTNTFIGAKLEECSQKL